MCAPAGTQLRAAEASKGALSASFQAQLGEQQEQLRVMAERLAAYDEVGRDDSVAHTDLASSPLRSNGGVASDEDARVVVVLLC